MNIMREKSTEERYYSCQYIQGGINFFPDNEVAVCCTFVDKDLHIANLKDLPEDLSGLKELILNKKRKMIENFKRNEIYDSCKKCAHLRKAYINDDDYKTVNHVSLNHYTSCNLKCIFCEYEKKTFGKSKDTDHKLILRAIKKLYNDGCLNKGFFVGIGGGEPSISNDLIEIIKYVENLGNNIHINTNAAKFSEVFAEGIKKDRIKILISADAGSREVYAKIKGADFFDTVWGNIEKYIDYIGEDNDKKIEVKFILQPENILDINNMINICVKTKVKNVVCDMDLHTKPENHLIFKEPIAVFKKLCDENNLNLRKGLFLPNELWYSESDKMIPDNKESSPKIHKCSVCGNEVDLFLPYKYGGEKVQEYLDRFIKRFHLVGSDVKNFSCPICASSDRERHLFLFFAKFSLINLINEDTHILHIAPEHHLRKILLNTFYIAGDLYPKSFNYSVVKLDITKLPFKDNWFDFIICNHVLEHIPDDHAAMSELYRVLKPGGRAILQTPFSAILTTTDEDENITDPVDRVLRFGQHDHVRLYGLDFFNRLANAGFILDIKVSKELFSDEQARYNGFNNEEDLILCSK